MNQMAKMNEAVGMKNHVTINGGGKRLVIPFRSHEFCKCIGCTLSAVNYGNKGHKRWSEITKYSGKMALNKIRRDVCRNTDLYKVCCDHYRHFYTYACH